MKGLNLLSLCAVYGASTWAHEQCNPGPLGEECADEAKVSLLQLGRQAAARGRDAGHSHSNATEGATDALNEWAILSITHYRVKEEHTSDWFSRADVYARVKVHPSGKGYASKMIVNKNKGNVDLHLYVPRSATSATIDLYDQDDVFSDYLMGSVNLPLLSNPNGCAQYQVGNTGCDYTLSIHRADGTRDIGTVSASVISGKGMQTRARELNYRGVLVLFEDITRTRDKMASFSIKSVDVEQELSYARAGSVIPESLHGIFWMDQHGVHLPVPSDPGYKHVCNLSAPEILVSYGAGGWNPETLCVEGLRQYGGPPIGGQWTWFTQKGGKSASWASGEEWNAKYDFCFRDKTFQEIDVYVGVSVNKIMGERLGNALGSWTKDTYITVPRWINNVKMNKKPWGWDRETTIAPEAFRSVIKATFMEQFGTTLGNAAESLMAVFSGYLQEDMMRNGIACNYPVFQIIDGYGRRTEHFQAYLDWATNGRADINTGNGSQLVGRQVG